MLKILQGSFGSMLIKNLKMRILIPKLPQTFQNSFCTCLRCTSSYKTTFLMKLPSKGAFYWTMSQLIPWTMRDLILNLPLSFLIIAQPLKKLFKIRKLSLVDKFPGNRNNFSDKPYLKQQNNGDRFFKGTVYVPTKKTCP